MPEGSTEAWGAVVPAETIRSKVAVIEIAELTVTEHAWLPEQAPDHPKNLKPEAADALRLSVRPPATEGEQPAEHEIPFVESETDPEPTRFNETANGPLLLGTGEVVVGAGVGVVEPGAGVVVGAVAPVLVLVLASLGEPAVLGWLGELAGADTDSTAAPEQPATSWQEARTIPRTYILRIVPASSDKATIPRLVLPFGCGSATGRPQPTGVITKQPRVFATLASQPAKVNMSRLEDSTRVVEKIT